MPFLTPLAIESATDEELAMAAAAIQAEQDARYRKAARAIIPPGETDPIGD